MTEPVHWHVLGAGAMGTLLSYRLHSAGVAVTLLHHKGPVRRTLVIDEARRTLAAESLTGLPRGAIRFLLLTTKAGQLAAALRLAMPWLHSDAVIATTANGLGIERTLSPLMDTSTLLRAHSTEGAYRDAGGDVIYAGAGQTRMGRPGSDDSAPGWFGESLGRLARWRWDRGIDAGLARKFAINCAINGLTARFRCLNGELLSHSAYHTAFSALCEESEPALRQLQLWQGADSLLEVATAVCRGTAANRSSMLQDVLAGRPTELPFLNGELLRRAEREGLTLPLNHELVTRLS